MFVGGLSGFDIQLPMKQFSRNHLTLVGIDRGTIEQLKQLVELLSSGQVGAPSYSIHPVNDAQKVSCYTSSAAGIFQTYKEHYLLMNVPSY